MELGDNLYGLHHRVTKVSQAAWFNVGDHRFNDKISELFVGKYYSFHRGLCNIIYSGSCGTLGDLVSILSYRSAQFIAQFIKSFH